MARKSRTRNRAAYPKGVETRYRAMLLRRVRALDRLVRKEIVPALNEFDGSKAGAPIVAGDDSILRVDAVANALTLVRVLEIAFARANPAPVEFLRALAGTIDGRLTPALGAAVVSIPNPLAIDAWVEENVKLITSIQSKYLADVALIIETAQIEGLSTKLAGKAISARTGVALSRGRLIARDQIATVNAQITSQRHKEAGVTHFIWRTSEDERVRDSHEALNGRVFSYDAPPSEGLPGEPIQCRCTAEPVLGALTRAR